MPRRIRLAPLLCLLAAGLLRTWPVVAGARMIRVESLEAAVTPDSAGPLAGLSCRNVDRIVRLRLSISWPGNAMSEEKDGFKRLVVWTAQNEFLFPSGAYHFQHGAYLVDGYFIARNGGAHQGIVSNAFEKIDDAQVLLNPAVREVRVSSPKCR